MRPVLRRGRSVLERELLTRDEIDQRLAAFRALLEASGLEAAVVVGTVEAFAPLTYLTAYAPMRQWATALVHRSEPTVLLAGLMAAGSGGVAAASRDVVVVEGGTRPLREVSGA